MDADPKNYINDSNIEMSWAVKASQHAEVHFKLLKAIPDPKKLRLTPQDDKLYKKFREVFPDLGVIKLNNDDIKSETEKAKWREYCNSFEGLVEDFNFATLLRLDSCCAYTDSNTTLVPRAQFLAIEVTRNREGVNDNARNIVDSSS